MFEFLSLSINSLKRRKLRTALTMLGIIIGIAAVVSLISLGEGLRTAITGQFGSLSADKLTIQNSGSGFGPPGSTSIRKLTSHDLKIIESVSGVEKAIPRLIRIGKFEFNKASSFNYLTDLLDDAEAQRIFYDSMNVEVEDGRLLESGDRRKVLLGSSFSEEELYGKKIKVGDKIKIQGNDFDVIGILKESSSFQVNLIAIIPTEDLKELFGIGDEIDLIVVQLEDDESAEEVAATISQKLRRDRGEKPGEEDFSVQTPLQAISSINTILNIINLIVTGIAAISLIIGGIGIANTMYTSVMERKKEIGTMKAVGAKNKDILYLFVFESGLIGLIGGVVGAGIGLGMAFLVSEVANTAFGSEIISVSLSWSLLIGAVLFSFGIGLVSGWFPSRQASKLKPVDALRG